MGGIVRVWSTSHTDANYNSYVTLLKTMRRCSALPAIGRDVALGPHASTTYNNPRSAARLMTYAIAWASTRDCLTSNLSACRGQRWNGMMKCVNAQGLVGYIQATGSAPAAALHETHDYGLAPSFSRQRDLQHGEVAYLTVRTTTPGTWTAPGAVSGVGGKVQPLARARQARSPRDSPSLRVLAHRSARKLRLQHRRHARASDRLQVAAGLRRTRRRLRISARLRTDHRRHDRRSSTGSTSKWPRSRCR